MLETAVIISIIASATLVVTLIAKLIYSSKCREVSCGCCKIIRDTDHETSVRNISGMGSVQNV